MKVKQSVQKYNKPREILRDVIDRHPLTTSSLMFSPVVKGQAEGQGVAPGLFFSLSDAL